MVSLWHLGCIFTGIFCYIFFNIQIKKAIDIPFTCVAAYIFCNILFLLGTFLLEGTSKYNFNITENAVLLITSSLILASTIILLSYLLKNYSLSEVMLVLQLGVIVGTIGYYFLGNIPSTQQLIGICFITLGAIISGFKQFEFPNIFKPLVTIPIGLYLLGILYCFINNLTKMVIFIASQKTIETEDIDIFINHLDHAMPHHFVSFENALQFVISRAPFLIIVFFVYLLYKENFSLKDIIKKAKQDYIPILIGGFFISIYTLLYFYVFQTIPHKATLSALNKFKLPLTILFAALILKEKISFPKKVATALIIGGGLLTIV